MGNKGFVYLLLEVDQLGNESHKIGTTKRDIKKRICELQTGNSNQISLLQHYVSQHYKTIEKWLHAKFSTRRTLVENEWFKLDDADVTGFVELCKKTEETILFLNKGHYDI